jgi:hypothetical protein
MACMLVHAVWLTAALTHPQKYESIRAQAQA